MMAQIKSWKPQEYWMYFKVSMVKSWGIRAAIPPERSF